MDERTITAEEAKKIKGLVAVCEQEGENKSISINHCSE
jgi:hypothetical protein